ncbi:HK97 family phage prohead protease [Bradyrhizobium sp. CCBAU 11361]|uniref:HK97 family phage prohead protease n=1 Tax=Bradyrhizobium sp. CCBAU 11361 TaxID=1630812 RepID=UPI00230463E0|nr:HK97 family phage prohead protease [Bradyrhizobium sp. CCBAU 11361]MDA9487945.1 hypothetical protein [Bradyrhizobium sp. CCBAU 11361]
MIDIDAADMRVIDRMNRRYGSILNRMRVWREPASEAVTGLALDGYGIVYDEPLIYDDEIWVFEAGCFSDSLKSGQAIYFQLDHDDKQRLASTRDAVSFADNEIGLAFRLDLSEVERGAELKRMVDTDRRAAISVGIRNEETRVQTIGKHPVRFITRADLIEVSLVGAGKCANAFAGIVNAGFETLEPGKKGVMFTANFAEHKLKRMKKSIAERNAAVDSISAKLDRMEGKRPIASVEAGVRPDAGR